MRAKVNDSESEIDGLPERKEFKDKMYSEIAKSEQEIKHVLENLCDDTVLELTKIFGQSYKKDVFNQIKQLTTGRSVSDESSTLPSSTPAPAYLIKLKSTGEPVGLFGLIPCGAEVQAELELSDGDARAKLHRSKQNTNSAGIFLLTTNKLHNGNVITFLRQAKATIEQWLNEYDLIMDYCYKKNLTIQKWLRLLGFKPSLYQDNEFQVYYKMREPR